MADPLYLHGVFLCIFGKGVLLTGNSGCGKSECALHLLDRAHQLIADDLPEFTLQENVVVGRCPAPLKQLLEIRGLGILDVQQWYGEHATLPEHRLDLIIELTQNQTPTVAERVLQPKLDNKIILGKSILHLHIDIALSKNLAILVESAVRLAFAPPSPVVERLLG